MAAPQASLFASLARGFFGDARRPWGLMGLGAVFGAANGYLVIGSIWWFLHQAGYQNFSKVLNAPPAGTPLADAAMDLLARMPPEYLMQAPHIFITIAFAFAFVVIVYV